MARLRTLIDGSPRADRIYGVSDELPRAIATAYPSAPLISEQRSHMYCPVFAALPTADTSTTRSEFKKSAGFVPSHRGLGMGDGVGPSPDLTDPPA
jgi:hypothetical protein